MTKGLGMMMMFMGVGGFVLPLIGLQFRILSIFGPAQYIIAGAMAFIGLLLFILGGNSRPRS